MKNEKNPYNLISKEILNQTMRQILPLDLQL